MKQKLHTILKPELTQKLRLNHHMVQSLEFLYLDYQAVFDKINKALETNPFLEMSLYNYDDEYAIQNYIKKPTLVEDLQSQLLVLTLPYNKQIMNYLLYSLNQYGFLTDSYQNYINDLNITKKELLYHINILQSLEPPGVGAKDMIDSICIQLNRKGYYKSSNLIKNNRSLILSMDYTNIKKTLHLTKKEIEQLYLQIKSCNPYPCSNYDEQRNSLNLPDILIKVENKTVQIEAIKYIDVSLNKELFNKVRNNPSMKEYFKDAHFLIENLNHRTNTILKVSNELIKIQKNHFLFNDELFPCDLKTLSHNCHLHQSTISRTLNKKYYLFNNEVYPLKKLMVSKTKSGDSSDSIKKAIQLFIDEEDKTDPLTDEELEQQLKLLNLGCSRRTIAKYRQDLNIPSSFKRKIK